MVVLKLLWGVVKVGLFLLEVVSSAVDQGGRDAVRHAAPWGQADEPPSRDRNSVFYDGPGHRR